MYVFGSIYSRDGGASVCSGSASDDSEWSSSSDEETEALYHKRYIFTKRMAKGIIYVRSQCVCEVTRRA